MPTWRRLEQEARERLGSASESRRIVARAAGLAVAELQLRLDDPAPGRTVPFVAAMVERRAAGEPLQYVLGVWGFRRLDLLVDHRVLIPRPETEMVVETALAELDRLGGPQNRPRVADLGTGSGAIALSIAGERPASQVWGTDISADALVVARANLAGCGSAVAIRVNLLEGRWYEALPRELAGRLRLVVSNPPYVSSGELLPAEVADWEPALALRSGPDGLDAIAEIVAGACDWLDRPGTLVVEVAPAQAAAAMALARLAGCGETTIRPDLAGRPRALVARWENHPR